MRRGPRFFLLAWLLAAGGAPAGWTPAGPFGAGVPNDFSLVDAGTAVVAHSGGATIVYGSPSATWPGVSYTVSGGLVGARTGPADCFYGMRSTTEFLSSSPECGSDGGLAGGLLARAFASSPGRAGYAVVDFGPQRYAYYHGDAGFQGAWQSLGPVGAATTSTVTLGVTSVGQVNWALVSSALSGQMTVVRDDFPRLFGGVSRGSNEVTLFPNAAVAGALLAVRDGGLIGTLDVTPDAGQPFALLLREPPGELSGVAFVLEGGDPLGRGFGLAIGDAGLWGAVPNPAAPAQIWVPRPELVVPGPARIRCLSPANCLVLSASPGAGNSAVNWYFNVAAPGLDGGAFLATTPNGVPLRVRPPVGDSDGDPIWVTWDPIDAGSAGSVSVSQVLDGGADFGELADLVPSGFACGLTSVPFTFWASDGLAAHATQFTGQLAVTRAEAPSAPQPSPSSVRLFAGLGGTTLGFNAGDGGCPADTVTWTVPGDAGLLGTPMGLSLQLDPSAIYCGTEAPTTVTLTVSNDAGSVSVPVQVSVVPYGAPTVGVFTPSFVRVDAGSSTSAQLAISHPCEAVVTNFAMQGLYAVDGGGPTIVVRFDGGRTVEVASLDACVSDSVQVFGRAQVVGEDAGRVSVNAGSFTVDFVANLPPLAASQFDAGPAYDAPNARAFGDLSLANTCIAQRGLGARIAVYGSAGAPVSGPRLFDIPGPWELPVPGGCSGGSFFVKAELVRDAGEPTGIEQTYPFTATAFTAGVGSASPAQVVVRCGEPLAFTAQAQPAAGACQAQEYAWTQVGGPTLDNPIVLGQQVDFTGPDSFGLFGGAQLEFELVADAGFGNVSRPYRHTVALGVAPFVRLSHQVDPLPAREGEATALWATLENTGDCEVSGLVLHESLGRMRYVAGSARLAGQALDATVDAGTLDLGPLALPARGKVRVSYLVRAPLVSRLSVEGAVSMRDARVDLPGETELPASCGCASSGGFGGLVALAALAQALARRRRRCG